MFPDRHDEGLCALPKERQREPNRPRRFNGPIAGDYDSITDSRNRPRDQQDGATRLPDRTLQRKIGQAGPSPAGCAMMIKSETRPFAATRSASVPGSAEKPADKPLPGVTIDVPFRGAPKKGPGPSGAVLYLASGSARRLVCSRPCRP